MWKMSEREDQTMRNTLADLNNHLFEQLERLNDEDLDDDALEKELKRADGMSKIAEKIIHNGELAYKTIVHMDEYGKEYDAKGLPLIGGGK